MASRGSSLTSPLGMAAALRTYSFTNSLGSGFTSSLDSPAALRLHRLAWQWFYGPSASPTHVADLQLGFRSWLCDPSASHRDFAALWLQPFAQQGLCSTLGFTSSFVRLNSSALGLADAVRIIVFFGLGSPFTIVCREGRWVGALCVSWIHLSFLCNAFCHDLFDTSVAPLYLVLPVGSSSLLSFAWLARGALGS